MGPSKDNMTRIYKVALYSVLAVVMLIVGYFVVVSRKEQSCNVLLITIDALRADHLGCYGYRLETSPTIDRLAKEGIRFTDCTVQWPKTTQSMASMLTGMYPKTSGIRAFGSRLSSSFNVLSEVFRENGYRTGAVVANFNIGKKFGFDQGFDRFVESWQEAWKKYAPGKAFENRRGKVKMFTNATIVTDQAVKWLIDTRESKKPFFLWLHYMDPHGPYIPPRAYEKYFVDAHESEQIVLSKLPKYQLYKDRENGQAVTDIGFYRTMYDREIRYLDDELARLFEKVKQLEGSRKTVIVFAADHGESLGEHDYYLEHGKFSYQPCAHIPLIIIKVGVLAQAKTIKEPVGLIDMPVTLLELVDIKVPKTFEGRSLLDMMLGEKNASVPEYTFMETGYDIKHPQLTVRHGRWKLIHVQSQLDLAAMTGSEYELYDVYSDPQELNNLATQKPTITNALSKILHKWYASGSKHVNEASEVDFNTLDDKTKEMLRSLGYLK